MDTHCVELFAECAGAIRRGVAMVPRSDNDKEYFPQDWFIDRLAAVDLPYLQQGRNSYPDFWVGGTGRPPIEGYEVKSLSFSNGKPARRDCDSNSTIPSGRKNGRDIFMAFFLYTGSGQDPRPVHSLSIAHVDLINADYAVADAHTNQAVHGFGSYGDGFIRNRKMYVFPHPLSLDPTGLGCCHLIVPSTWHVSDPRLVKVAELQRTIAAECVRSYSIELLSHGDIEVQRASCADAGTVRTFDVFELGV